mgnify:CR=1 FL=1
MFDVGFAEIFLLSLIGLIVLGPDKLPRVARTLGGLVRRARSSWYSLRRSIEAELAEADVTEPIKKAAADLEQAGRSLEQTIGSAGEADTNTPSSSALSEDKQNPEDG